jgi:TPR repeat protein
MRIKLIPLLTFFCLLPFCLPAFGAENEASKQTKEITPEALFAAMLVNAENGQPQAMLSVGMLYEQGLGVPKNFGKALEWYERAAFSGEKEGYFRLGVCNEVGMGTVADMTKAVAAYEKAAAMGSASALHKMASLYLTGRGMPKNEVRNCNLIKLTSYRLFGRTV